MASTGDCLKQMKEKLVSPLKIYCKPNSKKDDLEMGDPNGRLIIFETIVFSLTSTVGELVEQLRLTNLVMAATSVKRRGRLKKKGVIEVDGDENVLVFDDSNAAESDEERSVIESIRRELKLFTVANINDVAMKAIAINGKYLKSDKEDDKIKSRKLELCIRDFRLDFSDKLHYTTARLGSFTILTNKAIAANDGKTLPLYHKALYGLTVGAIGMSVGSPADLALIRMQTDATLPLAQHRNYKNAFHALARISADEGVTALWKGVGPTIVRAMPLNMGILASYDQSVELFKDQLCFGEASTVVGESAVSRFFAAACSLPFDYVKTHIQKMQPDATGKYPYKGSLDCTMKTLKA
ncbi:hypothetical protein GIB67_039806 [Kingdonia uniflora]|uniref:Uncharacterized protein n=1 Tax=Kingdonia uniflora TaxID=39325 RepID=A0A7J7P348_9MAGN|nr:hypothetical protein GIB67_039806 [Kingdonia uniflora]